MSLILLVDDDKDMMRLAARWLTRAGYDVDMVTSGPAALDYLKEKKPQLILLDSAMPGMDGPETFRAIRADDAVKDIPVVFRTGLNGETILEITDRLHPEGIVAKSEGKAALMQAVKRILG